MRALNLQQLRTFTEVVARGSFSQAAAQLRVTQPAVSLQVRNLEQQLGVRLIERVGRQALPTPAGRDLLLHARRIQEECAAALAHMQNYREGDLGRVRIGTGATACIYLLPRVLMALRVLHPGFEINVTTGDTPELLDAVEANSLDVALVTLPATRRSLLIRELFQDPLVAVFPPSESIPVGPVRPTDLSNRSLILYDQRGTIRSVIDAWFVAGGVNAQPAMEMGSFEAIKELVASGLGCSILPSMALETTGRSRRLQVRQVVPQLRRRYGLALRLDKVLHKTIRVAVEAIERMGREHPSTTRSGRRAQRKAT
jgi:DNA-binding transcriptional LysR family regulator